MRRWGLLAVVVALLIQSGRVVAAPVGREVTVVEGVDIVTLDPAFASDRPSQMVIDHVYDQLVAFGDEELNIVPELARRWSVSADGRVWTFNLRDGVVFTDGSPLNAIAVKFTLERILAPGLGSPNRGLLEPVERVDVADENTVRIVTRSPFAALLENLSMIQTSIVSPRAVGRMPVREYGRTAVGSGPFVLKEWNPGVRVVLERNPRYWGGTPQVERIVYRPVPEGAARVVALESGEADVVARIPPEAVGNLRRNPRVEVLVKPSTFQISFELNQRRKPFDDVRVRRAINLAVDKRAIVEKILLGFGSVPEGVIPPGGQYSVKLPAYEYAPDRARALLAEAGFPQGFTTVMWAPRGRYLKDAEIAEAVQGYLANVGIRAELRFWEWGPYVEAISRPEKEAGLYMLGVSIPTADWRLSRNFYSRASSNYSGYRNEEVDRLILGARATFDRRRQRAMYEQAQKLIWEDAPFLFLYNQVQIIGVRKGLTGLKVFGFETMRFNDVKVER